MGLAAVCAVLPLACVSVPKAEKPDPAATARGYQARRLDQVLRRELTDRDPEFEAAEVAASQLVLNTVPTCREVQYDSRSFNLGKMR